MKIFAGLDRSGKARRRRAGGAGIDRSGSSSTSPRTATDRGQRHDTGHGDRCAREHERAFAELHRRRFGYIDEDAEVIVDALVVEAIGRSPAVGNQRGGPKKLARSLRSRVIFDPSAPSLSSPVAGRARE